MSIVVLLINFGFAVLLYFINGMIGKWKSGAGKLWDYASFGFQDITEENFAGNFLQSTVHPAIYMALVGVVLQYLSCDELIKKLWIVIPLYWLIRCVHILIWKYADLINWKYEFLSGIISLILGEGTLFFVVIPLINDGKSIWIDLGQFRDAFWFAAFTYIASQVWNIVKKRVTGETVYPSSRKSKAIKKRYLRFCNKYDLHISKLLSKRYMFVNKRERQHFVCLLYAVMIFEDHNRPAIVRVIEYICKLFCRKRTFSLGIMQVRTNRLIGNKTSIVLAIKKLYRSYSSAEIYDKIECALRDYNSGEGYYEEVFEIYQEIVNICELPHLLLDE